MHITPTSATAGERQTAIIKMVIIRVYSPMDVIDESHPLNVDNNHHSLHDIFERAF